MLPFISATLTATGEIIVAYTVVKVHARIMQEHKIDGKVLKAMRTEQSLAIFGIILIALGWILYIIDTL